MPGLETRTVRFEISTPKTEEIVNTTGQFFGYLAHSGIHGIDILIEGLVPLVQRIRAQSPEEFLIQTDEEVDIVFSGIKRPTPRIDENGIIFQASEPTLAVRKNFRDLNPSRKSSIDRTFQEIIDEMQNVYKMDVMRDILAMKFPKEHYAKEIRVFDAALIAPAIDLQ